MYMETVTTSATAGRATHLSIDSVETCSREEDDSLQNPPKVSRDVDCESPATVAQRAADIQTNEIERR
jgi:hypothetical protein